MPDTRAVRTLSAAAHGTANPLILAQDGWPVHMEPFPVEAGQEMRLTNNPDATLSGSCLPVSYPFESLASPGDTFFVGRCGDHPNCRVHAERPVQAPCALHGEPG